MYVASAFAHFDTLRVTDPTAHGALNALFVDRFEGLSLDQRERPWQKWTCCVTTPAGRANYARRTSPCATNGVKLYQIHRFEVVGFRAVFFLRQ